MACSQFGQLWRKLRNQINANFGGIKQHQNFSERHTEIRVPKAAAKSEKVAKSRPKKVEPKDQNMGVATVVVRQVEELKAELDALKAQKLVEKGASPTNQKTAHVVNMNLNAKLMMTTLGLELFKAAGEMTSADEINRLYHLQHIGRVAMDIAQKVCCGDWLRLTFPDIPETEILKVKLYDLSAEIKKCLTKKVVKGVKRTDLKTWFPELVDQDVPATLPMWPNVATPGHPPRHPLREGLTPGWGMPSASPNPFDMARSQSLGMGASPQLDDRRSFASAQSRMSMSTLPGADYQGAISEQAQYQKFK